MEIEITEITTESIRLDQFLKWSAIASTGGEAKFLIQEGNIKVNQELETRRGRMLISGDLVEVHGAGFYQVKSANS